MKKFKLKLDSTINSELHDYLLQLTGINEVKIDKLDNSIYVLYSEDIIPLKILKLEIKAFLEIDNNFPNFLSFDKYSDNILENEIIIINDLCCEYCLKGMIEDLFDTDGIDTAYTNYDYHDKHDVKIFIKYDNQIINKTEIDKIKTKFNS